MEVSKSLPTDKLTKSRPAVVELLEKTGSDRYVAKETNDVKLRRSKTEKLAAWFDDIKEAKRQAKIMNQRVAFGRPQDGKTPENTQSGVGYSQMQNEEAPAKLTQNTDEKIDREAKPEDPGKAMKRSGVKAHLRATNRLRARVSPQDYEVEFQGKTYPVDDIIEAEPGVGIPSSYGLFGEDAGWTIDLPYEVGEETDVYDDAGTVLGKGVMRRIKGVKASQNYKENDVLLRDGKPFAHVYNVSPNWVALKLENGEVEKRLPGDLAEDIESGAITVEPYKPAGKVKASQNYKENDVLLRDGKPFAHVYNVSPNWVALKLENGEVEKRLPGDLAEDIESGAITVEPYKPAGKVKARKLRAVETTWEKLKSAGLPEGFSKDTYKQVAAVKAENTGGDWYVSENNYNLRSLEQYLGAEGSVFFKSGDLLARYVGATPREGTFYIFQANSAEDLNASKSGQRLKAKVPAPGEEEFDESRTGETRDFETKAKEELAKALSVSPEDLEEFDPLTMEPWASARVEAAGFKSGGDEYVVTSDAETAAETQVRMDLEEQPELFNQDWLMNYMDASDTDKRLTAQDLADSRADMRDSEIGAELARLGIEPGEQDPQEALADHYYEEILAEINKQGLADYLVGEGLYSDVAEVVKAGIVRLWGDDVRKAAEEAVSMDGAGHFLSSYDGETHDLPGGLVYVQLG